MAKQDLNAETQPKIHIVDCTLREGMQTPGVEFSFDDMMKIALRLDELGVALADAGMPASGPHIQRFLKTASTECKQMRIGASVRCIEREVELALDCGVRSVFVICPVSDIHLKERLRISIDHLCSQVETVAGLIKSAGATVELVAEDASR